MIAVLIEINIYCCLLALIYFSLRSFLKISARRLLLCAIPFLAIGIYFIKITVQSSFLLAVLPSIELDVITIGEGLKSATLGSDSIFTITNFYLLGIILFFVYSLIKVISALSYFKNSEFLPDTNVWLSATDRPQSFTFLNRIHLANGLDESDKIIVLEHELLHVKHNHSFDLLLMELSHAFYWINPVLFLLKKELICVHEYQVDKTMYQKHNTNYLKHLLASSMGVSSSQILLTSQFYNGLSLTQRKKQMKRKMKNNWAVLAVIPVLAFGLAFISFTSNDTTNVIPKMAVAEQDSVYDIADVLPEYPGGQTAMIQFIVENLVYPAKAKAEGISGTSYISFVVKASGKITDVAPAKEVNQLLDGEAVRVIKAMPNWTPGELDGKKVAVRYTIPLRFALPE